MDFIKRHPTIITAIFGVGAILLSIVSSEFAALGANLFFFCAIALYYAGIFLLAFNIAAMVTVLKDKPTAGILLSLPFGGLGAVIGTLFNPSYEYETAVKIIFSIQIWLGIWSYASAMFIGIPSLPG